ncbi:DUF7124 domain-containing protein [Natrinema gari]
MTGESMTLAFELAALQQAREPQAVVVDARRWAQNVGLTAAESGAAHAFSSTNLVRLAFRVAPTSPNFTRLHNRFTTERHVLVSEAPDPSRVPSSDAVGVFRSHRRCQCCRLGAREYGDHATETVNLLGGSCIRESWAERTSRVDIAER